jgi:carbonic anhydrase
MPSEHAVDGYLYPAEVHFVHTATYVVKEDGTLDFDIPLDNGGLAVLGVFFEEEACNYYLPKVDE